MKIVRKIKPEIKEKRGDITKLLDDGKSKIKSILLITSKAGSVRSNHYHRKDAHWIYILSGKMGYYEKPVKGNRIKKAILGPGDMVYTPPLMIHTTKFPRDTVFMAFSIRSRNQKNYEQDTVRVEALA